ncbi:MAG: glycosyltransferase [Myxococcales bacterium]|nr:glycosyltransferase [Myxococcales bacterium]
MTAERSLSVVMPVRDALDTLPEALDSVLSQRGAPAFEVVAVEDGSQDGSAQWLARCAARHRQVRVVESGGVGIARALNHGIAACGGDVIARMDADDVCMDTRLATQLAHLEAQPRIAVLGAQVELISQDPIGDGMRSYVAWQHSLTTPNQHHAQLFVESPVCHPSTILRRSAWASLGGYRDGPFPEDYDLWLRLDAAGYGIAKVPERLLSWRQGPDRATTTDPRYAADRFVACKAPFLARRLQSRPGAISVWGAGKTGKRLVRALEPHGVRVERFIDIDPRKIGRCARGAPIEDPDSLRHRRSAWLLVAVGARGARERVRQHLSALGYQEGVDYLCGS